MIPRQPTTKSDSESARLAHIRLLEAEQEEAEQLKESLEKTMRRSAIKQFDVTWRGRDGR